MCYYVYITAEQLPVSLGRFFRVPEVVYNTYNMCTQDLPDIYARALGLGHIYQANPLCPCHNYYIYRTYMYMYICIYIYTHTPYSEFLPRGF